MTRNITILLPIVLLSICSCKQYKDDSSFNEKIVILENHPEVILTRLDTGNITKITNEREATSYLLQTLARSHTIKGYHPNKKDLMQCDRIFKTHHKAQQRLETLYLIAHICRKEKDIQSEITTIKQAIKLAQNVDDNVWLFYLYSYLGDMYFRKYDILKFVKYQGMAKLCLKDIPTKELNTNTLTLLGKSYLYTDQLAKAEQLLSELADKIDNRHIRYSDITRLLGVTYYQQGKLETAAEEFKKSLKEETDTTNLFTCYSMLTFCAYRLHNIEQAQHYQKQTAIYDIEGETNYTEIEFYKLCADFARQSNNYMEEAKCMQKVIDKYDIIVKELNGQTLDGAIQGYMRIQDQQEYHSHFRLFLYLIFGILFLLAVMIIYHITRTKKQAYHYLMLQHRITELERLENIQDETKAFILRDLEIAKQIAMLKHTQKEKSEKLLKELDKLNMLEGNKLLSTKWEDFYHHINLTFNGFHTKLTQLYPSLNEKEVQLCCLMMAKFRTEEIAAVWMQSVFTVHKYKTSIRKKTNAPEAADIVNFLEKEISEQGE